RRGRPDRTTCLPPPMTSPSRFAEATRSPKGPCRSNAGRPFPVRGTVRATPPTISPDSSGRLTRQLPGERIVGHRTRAYLGLGLFAAVSTLAALGIWASSDPHHSTAAVSVGTAGAKLPPEREDLARSATEPFAEAETIRSVDGRLHVTLTVNYGDNVIRGSRVRLRCYNGRLVGPTLRAKPGDVLHVRLDNRLPEVPELPVHSVNVPHGLNSTNLHTHGLHVSPEGNSDNVYLDVRPGQTQDYEIKIPKDHVAGTFWYHPHRHGSVALQASSGMS